MIKAGIVGGAGYTAGELIRLLVNHPKVEIASVGSESNAGRKIYEVHSGLFGDTELVFNPECDLKDLDVLFLCMGHGKSREYLEKTSVPDKIRIIDLSQDFRDESDGFIYGLPETASEEIAGSTLTANPGCFATAIQLALLPAAKAGIISSPVNVTALTGSTGAGVKPVATTHFSYRNNNISAYKEFTHQHLLEIKRNIGKASGGNVPEINFIPLRGDFARGIYATAVFDSPLNAEQVRKTYSEFYKDAAFTHVVPFNLDMKQVVNTNKCLLQINGHEGRIQVVSVIDNLLKGASGQAVQNMNLMFGLPQDTGLKLKASAF